MIYKEALLKDIVYLIQDPAENLELIAEAAFHWNCQLVKSFNADTTILTELGSLKPELIFITEKARNQVADYDMAKIIRCFSQTRNIPLVIVSDQIEKDGFDFHYLTLPQSKHAVKLLFEDLIGFRPKQPAELVLV